MNIAMNLHMTISINRFQRISLLLINLPRAALGLDLVVPAWCVSIKGPK